MALSNVLPPSSRVTRSLRQTTPLPADTLHRLAKVSPHAISNLLDISQMHHPQPFDLPGWPNCPFMRGSTNPSFVRGIESPFIVLHSDLLISPHNPKSRVYDPVPTRCAQIQHSPLRPLVFGPSRVRRSSGRAVEPNL